MSSPEWQPPANALPIWGDRTPGYRPEYGQPVPTLTPYLVKSNTPTGAVVVCPGGGYGMKANHEGGVVAEWLNTLGISAFVLDYRVAPYRHPIPLADARRAIQLVRSKAGQWQVDPNKVGILGFSAGGHLTSTAGTHFEALDGLDLPNDEISRFSFIPNALVLCYPVISFGPFTHMGSCENLLGPNPSAERRKFFSNELQISSQTPPSFLWHTANDGAVPVENSLMFATGLRAKEIPFELHIFGDGPHGIGLAFDHPSAGPWTGLCARWLKQQGF